MQLINQCKGRPNSISSSRIISPFVPALITVPAQPNARMESVEYSLFSKKSQIAFDMHIEAP